MGDREISSLTQQVRDLQDRVGVLERQVAALLEGRHHDSPSTSVDFSLVVSAVAAATSTSVAYERLASRIPPLSASALDLCSALCGGRLTPRERVQRAWEAGHWARFVLRR